MVLLKTTGAEHQKKIKAMLQITFRVVIFLILQTNNPAGSGLTIGQKKAVLRKMGLGGAKNL